MCKTILGVRHAFMIMALLLLVSCAGGPANLVGLTEIEQPLAVTAGVTVQNLFIATSRSRSDDGAEFYSRERSQVMGFGNVDVTIPPIHETGQIEQPRRGKSDILKHFTIARPLIFENGAAFQAKINQALAERPKADRSVLVFVHGYNTNFTGAVLRMTQFVHDTGFKGVPVLFTWASYGSALDYVYDINSSLQARHYLIKLAGILANTNAESFSVVAHSMGNLVTLEAMTALMRQKFVAKAPLSSIILAAPDVDFDVFKEYMKDLEPIKDKIFVMVSKDDRALNVSGIIAAGVRVGSADPEDLAALGLSVIDLSQIEDKSSTNHSKFADSPEIVRLIGRGLNEGNTLSTTKTGTQPDPIGSVFKGVGQVAVGLGTVLTLGTLQP